MLPKKKKKKKRRKRNKLEGWSVCDPWHVQHPLLPRLETEKRVEYKKKAWKGFHFLRITSTPYIQEKKRLSTKWRWRWSDLVFFEPLCVVALDPLRLPSAPSPPLLTTTMLVNPSLSLLLTLIHWRIYLLQIWLWSLTCFGFLFIQY